MAYDSWWLSISINMIHFRRTSRASPAAGPGWLQVFGGAVPCGGWPHCGGRAGHPYQIRILWNTGLKCAAWTFLGFGCNFEKNQFYHIIYSHPDSVEFDISFDIFWTRKHGPKTMFQAATEARNLFSQTWDRRAIAWGGQEVMPW